MNAIADSTKQPLVTISSNGTNVFNNNAPFATVSDFKGITPGDISVSVHNESAINASRTITLEQGKYIQYYLQEFQAKVILPGGADQVYPKWRCYKQIHNPAYCS